MFKKYVGKLNDTVQKLNCVIKENDQYITLLERVVVESKEGIRALKNYSVIETPGLEAAIKSLAELFVNIENARAQKAAQLREKYLKPLNYILSEANKLNNELKDEENARKDVEKAEKKYEKEKQKKYKHKPADLPGARAALMSARKKLEKEEEEAKLAAIQFNKIKLLKMQEIITNLAEIEMAHNEEIIGMLGIVKEKADAINIDDESKVIIP